MRAFLLLLLLATTAPAADTTRIDTAEADRLFALAGELYREGDYAAAAATYTTLLDDDYANGALHHNLGMAHLGADDLGPAVLHLGKAARLLPDDHAVATHLQQARGQVEAEAAVLPTSPVIAMAVRIADAVSLGGLLGLGLLLWVGALAALGWRLWRGGALSDSQKAILRRGLLIAFPLAVLLLATAAVASAERYAPRAVVLDATPLAATPGGLAEGAAVPEGVTVRLRDAAPRGRWLGVRLPGGAEGWLPAAALGRL